MTERPIERQPDGSIEVRVHVVPGAGRSEIVGRHGDALKVRVAAPPEDGKANRAVVDLLAKALLIRSSEITLVAGTRGHSKRLRVAAGTGAEVEDRLRAFLTE